MISWPKVCGETTSFRRWWILAPLMTRLLGRVDRAAILKWKRDFFPATLAPEERRFLERMEKMRRWWPFPVRRLYRRGKVRVSPPLVKTSPVENPPVEASVKPGKEQTAGKP